MREPGLPFQLMPVAEQHAVAAYARQLAIATDAPSGTEHDFAAVVREAGALVEGGRMHVQFTDRLYGGSPEAAAEWFDDLATRLSVTVTLHDVPQPSDGPRNLARRAACYGRVAQSAAGVVVNSRHEAALLAEYCLAGVALEPAVIPLPVVITTPEEPGAGAPAAVSGSVSGGASPIQPSDQPETNEVALLGYVYPGKGHAEVIDAIAALAGDHGVSVSALGRASDGHEADLDRLVDRAGALGVQFHSTGYLSDSALASRLGSAAVPLIAHQHVSASASLTRWIGAGRRPLVPDSRYWSEMAELRPGTVTLYSPGALASAVSSALADPASTWLAAGASIEPGLGATADAYCAWWRSLETSAPGAGS